MTYVITAKNIFIFKLTSHLEISILIYQNTMFLLYRIPISYLETLHSVDAPIFAVKFLCMFDIRLGSMVYNDIAATDAPCMRLGIS